MTSAIKYKNITRVKELETVVSLQKLIWGKEAVTEVPQLFASIQSGGSVIGAYLDDELAGFCYGFPGYQSHNLYLYSHMMGILPSQRNNGIGLQLKLQQRLWAKQAGYEKIIWTYDPLQTRNAHLNLNKLGGYVDHYKVSYYGEMKDKINTGFPTDRFLLEWDIGSERVSDNLRISEKEKVWQQYRKLSWTTTGSHPVPETLNHAAIDEQGYLVPVPADIERIKQENFNLALEWRLHVRNKMLSLLEKDYRVVGLLRQKEPVHYYVLENKSDRG
ncbi:GNAT family N-acetyltransferase [Fictibacillus fluitans]|uniref:GNAT family N-acetyltransferase n=1 Tax=Fictibacillus fluitans TaxID=3058422 RepID=A0ABT8HTD2_9BACL|nr:GNAT family N-acetyltransferase [Fictibacillus sp. NE201]MDN4524037.1 GNAT family N-acetyltransferase [Fictibacillus sp. NE201]